MKRNESWGIDAEEFERRKGKIARGHK